MRLREILARFEPAARRKLGQRLDHPSAWPAAKWI